MTVIKKLIINIIVFFFYCFLQEFILDNRALWLALKKCLKLKPGSNYKKLRTVLEEDKQWPPIGTTVYDESEKSDGDSKEYFNPAFQNDDV